VNKRQLEVLKASTADEKKVISLLERVYQKASDDCEKKIADLAARTDLQNIQSIVYQQQYQKAIKKQLDGILDTLHTESFEGITDYLGKCYENGFYGTLYDLHGQGCPVMFPIDQRQVVKALQTDAKLSKGMYSRLGEDVTYLKKSVRAELSRGISQGSTWVEMASRISKGMNSPFKTAMYNSMRIARTEGHRIQSEAQWDTVKRAKEKGADIVKQWDATLDKRTRRTHRLLDGQIRELDEPFEVDGKKAMYPGGFGIAKEDIHCRCTMLQRARWALDEDELNELKDRAAFFKLDKVKDFEDYKNKYLQMMNQTQNATPTGSKTNSINDCKDFASLTKHMKDTYGVTVDSSVGNLDYSPVQQSMSGIEKVMQEFPQAQTTLKAIGTDNAGVMCASYSGSICFNPKYYDDASHLSGMIMSDTTGFHPKNTGIVETGSHEMGHLLERTLIEKANPGTDMLSQFRKANDWSSSRQAQKVISEASKAVKASAQGRNPSTGKLYKIAELEAQVSGYATTNKSECLAECVADYVANGKDASPLSREVWKILKRELG